jgi:hypothetical protein
VSTTRKEPRTFLLAASQYVTFPGVSIAPTLPNVVSRPSLGQSTPVYLTVTAPMWPWRPSDQEKPRLRDWSTYARAYTPAGTTDSRWP